MCHVTVSINVVYIIYIQLITTIFRGIDMKFERHIHDHFKSMLGLGPESIRQINVHASNPPKIRVTIAKEVDTLLASKLRNEQNVVGNLMELREWKPL